MVKSQDKQPFAKKLSEFEKKLDLMSIDGSISTASTEFLKGQKNGELMMIKKVKKLIKRIFLK